MSVESRLGKLERDIRGVTDRIRALTTQIPTRYRKGGGGGFEIKEAETKVELEPLMESGQLGQTTGETKRGYWKQGDTLICVTHLE